MSAATEHPSRRGSCRVLMMGTVSTAAAAAAVLAIGTQDALLLRLGLVAALWAALLGAFAAAQMRREARSSADHAVQLRSTYQLELEREVTARREHALTVERELREQAELAQRRELVELRAELAAMRATLERLGGAPLVERVALRAESTRLLPLPAQPRNVDVSAAAAQVVPAQVVPAQVVAVARSRTGTRFGPDPTPVSDPEVFGRAGSYEPGRHGTPARSPATAMREQGQRTVDDLIAAHGGTSTTPRRRRKYA